jgi:hypothetical protein
MGRKHEREKGPQSNRMMSQAQWEVAVSTPD